MGDGNQPANLNLTSTFKSPPKYSFCSAPPVIDKKKNMPGPGQYVPIPADKDKFTRTPSWSIGGAPKDGKEWGAMPGPGAYTPANTGFVSPKWPFSTDSRLKERKRATTPGPGSYEVRGNLEALAPSICSKPEGKLRATTPGPGAYKPSWDCCSNMGSSPKLSFGGSSRTELKMSKVPGPGQYAHLTSLGGNCSMKSPPTFTIKGRYKMPEPFKTPGFIACPSTFK